MTQGDLWLSGAQVETLAPGRLAALRRLIGKGPLTQHNCRDCGFALKSIDVVGHVHEGDLFWGHESPRPAGTSLANGCARCGGVLVDGADLARAGGKEAFERNLAWVARDAS